MKKNTAQMVANATFSNVTVKQDTTDYSVRFSIKRAVAGVITGVAAAFLAKPKARG